LNLPAAKFFKSSFRFRKPQRFGIGLYLIVNSRNQTLRKPKRDLSTGVSLQQP
jgi:hypothetical protein